MREIITKNVNFGPVLLLVVVGVLFVASIPLVTRVRSSWGEVGSLTDLVAKLGAKRDQLRALSTTVPQEVTLGSRALPERPGILAAIARVREVANQHGLTLLQIQVSIEPGSGGLASSRIRVDVEGAASNLRPFLEAVERSLPFIRVSAGRMSQSGGRAQTSVTLVTYWKNFPEALPSIETPLPSLATSEQELLSQLSEFQGRSGVSPISPTGGIGRPNPFSF